MGNRQRADLSVMAAKWPSAIVAREAIKEFTGGTITPKTICMLDSAGEGPQGRIRIGNKIVYPIEQLIHWLEERSEIVPIKTSA